MGETQPASSETGDPHFRNDKRGPISPTAHSALRPPHPSRDSSNGIGPLTPAVSPANPQQPLYPRLPEPGSYPSIELSAPHGQKRGAPTDDALMEASSAKRQSKWSAQENALIVQLRGDGMKWDDISKRLPGRSAISCRLHYQNFLERRAEWSDEQKTKLARLYDR